MKKENYGEQEIYLAPETDSTKDAIILEAPSEEKANEDISAKVEVEPKRTVRVNEILELREGNRKVFRMSDGTEQAVFYPETVHVFDEDTETFDEVDNTIKEEEDGRHYVSGKNHFKVRFSCEEDNDELFSIESGMHKVTVSAKKNSKQRNKGIKPLLCKKMTDGIERSNALVFAGVQDGSDYEYSVIGNGVKENIIVKEKAEVYRYSFIIRQENVTAEFNQSDKRIGFISNETGEEVFFIPAPFMTDENGAISTDVFYEVKKAANGDVVLKVIADSEWMNAQERAFPVVIDPQIQLSGTSAMTTYSWDNGSLYSASLHTVGTTDCSDGVYIAKRMYMSFNMPELPRNPRIKKAELKFCQASSTNEVHDCSKLGLYHVTEGIYTGDCTPYHDPNLIDFAKMQIGGSEDGEVVSYTFDVTTLVDQANKGEVGVKNLVLKMIDETTQCDNSIMLYGNSYGGTYAPQFIVTYVSSYGVNTSYRTHTHELGRFGQGSIDLQCGNLMFDSEDFAWAGNRMPVNIKHLYNSALSAYQYTENSVIKLPTADFTAMKVGNGFKLNIMQSMMSASFQHEGEAQLGYVYIGENGEEVYFKESNEQSPCDNNSQCYNLYEDVNGGDMLYDPVTLTLKQGDETYEFDYAGRLIKITDASDNHMDITYTSDRITSVTDGAGRDFNFAYNSNGFLTSITAPDNTNILYTYSGNLLSTITYPDGKKVAIAYTSNKPTEVTLFDAADNSVYKVAYTFTGDRVASVTEYGSDDSIGAKSTYSYWIAAGRTVVETTEQADDGEDENIIKTVYTFDDEGNIVSEYVYSEDIGNIGVDGEESGIHPYSGDGGVGVVSNINNLLVGHSFDNLNAWESMPNNLEDLYAKSYAYESQAKFGGKVLSVKSHQTDCSENGVYQTTSVLPAGEYTFSAYLRVTSTFSGTKAGAFIRVTDTAGKVLGISEILSNKDSEYTRLIVPFKLETAQSVQVQILVNGEGSVYFDAAQLENNPYANAYNMLENGNFELNTGWELGLGSGYNSGTRFNMSRALYIGGSIDESRYVCQNVPVKKNTSTRETFTLSGWAKGYGLPNHERDGVEIPTFRLRADIKYKGLAEPETHTADFSPCTEEWQLASVEFAKEKFREIEYITVYCDYGYNVGTAYFDDIQLVRNSIETSLSSSDFETTEEETESVNNEEATAETETTDTAPDFEEAKDRFGNALTETTFTDGEFGTIYRAFQFNGDECNPEDNAGNDLIGETDARGHITQYTVDEETSRNEEVIDRLGNKTAYEYDAAGKTTKVTSKDAEGTEIANVSYGYDAFDNMTEIVRGDGMKYALKYNAFHNLESIGIDGKTDGDLIKYTYKNGNGRLKEMTYANGDRMTATYNGVGQMVAEKWFNKDNALVAHYKYVYDGEGNIVRSIDILARKEYNYEYEEGKIIRATEADIVITDEIVTSKTVVNTIKYYYDSEGTMTKKVITSKDGSAQTIYYEQTEDDNTVVKFTAGGKTVTSHSKTDSFGRKVFDELQLGTGFVSRQFQYLAGEVTDEHKEKAKLKSSATTELVSQIVLSNGTTLSYGYDAEERITSVVETYEADNATVTNTTLYTYDALGQLLTETVNGTVVNTMTYDNYGNILTKNGITYCYDTVWKDKLTAVGNQTITYDKQGNPLTYLGNTLTWEKGRQLKSFGNISYTYNASGIRTSKTVDGIRHNFELDGGIILKETWGNNTLTPLYDNEQSLCGVIYNNEPFYFLKNLQGDIIGILDKDTTVVARYSYDAWGVPTITQDSSNCQIATVNPFRYRGYYYDNEIGMYYLQSRYYNPSVGRFVNGDEVEFAAFDQEVLSHNLFGYCKNEPNGSVDEFGYVEFSSTKKYYKISFNNWETTSIINAISWRLTIAGAVLSVLAAIPSLGISLAIGFAIVSVAQAFSHIFTNLNNYGNNKGLSINVSRKWYLLSYIGINKKEPKGFKNIFEVFESIKSCIKAIVLNIGKKLVKQIANMSLKIHNQIRKQIIVLFKMIYDAYCDKKVSKKNYANLL